MGLCVFKTKEVLPIFKHALRGTDHCMGWGATESPAPGLFFVHDEGVYIMSNADRKKEEEEGNCVAYAKGCNPKTDDDWWDKAHGLVGGDDFGEVFSFPTPKEQQEFLVRLLKFDELVISVTPRRFNMSFRKPKRS